MEALKMEKEKIEGQEAVILRTDSVPRSKSLLEHKLTPAERNLRQAVLTNFKNQNNYGMQSSLQNLNRWVLILEDGSNLASCNCVKVNIPRFLEKYDFETQKNQLDRVDKYYM
jgi:hypothetical protein